MALADRLRQKAHLFENSLTAPAGAEETSQNVFFQTLKFHLHQKTY